MPYCTKCGSEVTPEMLYCLKCGQRLTIPAAGARDDRSSVSAPAPKVNGQETAAKRAVRKGKLFREWVKYASLSTEAPSQKEAPSAKRASPVFYILIGVGIAVCIGLIILLARIW